MGQTLVVGIHPVNAKWNIDVEIPRNSVENKGLSRALLHFRINVFYKTLKLWSSY
jgi:hypothetical protein